MLHQSTPGYNWQHLTTTGDGREIRGSRGASNTSFLKEGIDERPDTRGRGKEEKQAEANILLPSGITLLGVDGWVTKLADVA